MVIDTDGSAFITKAEFDSLKNNFQAQIDNYNSSIDSKIDGAIAAYLTGIKLDKQETISTPLDGTDRKVEFVYGVDRVACPWYNGKYEGDASHWGGLAGDPSKGYLGYHHPQVYTPIVCVGPYCSSYGGYAMTSLTEKTAWNRMEPNSRGELTQLFPTTGRTWSKSGWSGTFEHGGDSVITYSLNDGFDKSGNRYYYPAAYIHSYWHALRGAFMVCLSAGTPGQLTGSYLPDKGNWFAAPYLEVGDYVNRDTLENCKYKVFYQDKADRDEFEGGASVSLILGAWKSSEANRYPYVANGAIPPNTIYETEPGLYNEGYEPSIVGMFQGCELKVTAVADAELANTMLYYQDGGDNTYRAHSVEYIIHTGDEWVSAYMAKKFGIYGKPHEGFPLCTIKSKGKVQWSMTVPSGFQFSIRSIPFGTDATTLDPSNVFDNSADNIVYTGTGTSKTFTTKELDEGTTIYIKMLNSSCSTAQSITFGDEVSLIYE